MPWRYPPPGGFAGFAQQTRATQSVLSAGDKTAKKKRTRDPASALREVKPRGKVYKTSKKTGKRNKTRDPNKRRRRKRKGSKRTGSLVKGSPAAKARMAKLRAMRTA